MSCMNQFFQKLETMKFMFDPGKLLIPHTGEAMEAVKTTCTSHFLIVNYVFQSEKMCNFIIVSIDECYFHQSESEHRG